MEGEGKSELFRRAISRQDFLRAALILAASHLLRYVPAQAAEGMEVSEVAPGVFVHQGRYEVQSPQNRGDILVYRRAQRIFA